MRPRHSLSLVAASIVLVLPPAAASAASNWASTCEDAQGPPSTLRLWAARPGPVDGFDDQRWAQVPAPWQRGPQSWLVGVVQRPQRSGTALRVCTNDAEAGTGRNAAVGAPIRVPASERVLAVAVADPWIAWAAARRTDGLRRPVVRWQRVSGRGGVQERRLRGRLTALVPTVSGDVVTSLVRAGRQRIALHRAGARSRLLVPSRVSSDRRTRRPAPLSVWLWQPRTIAVATSADPTPLVAALRMPSSPTFVELGPGADDGRCRPSLGLVRRARTRRLIAQVSDARRWARAIDGESRVGLRLCTNDGRSILLAGAATDDTDSGGSTFSDLDVVGAAVVLQGSVISRGGAWEDQSPEVRVLVTDAVDPGIRRFDVVGRLWLLDSRAAVWQTLDGLWISDSVGVRSLGDPPNVTRVSLDGETVLVEHGGTTTRLPFRPLDPRDSDVRRPVAFSR